ncbi:hypothetical protein IDVR_17970 [Intrasporangium sp. DVR]
MPNHATPQRMSRPQSPGRGHVGGRRKTRTPRARVATRSRPRDRAPGGTSWPRCRIATKADAQRTSVMPMAARTTQVGARLGVVGSGAERPASAVSVEDERAGMVMARP